jgi:uncharacterized glyoxalase superfamily protein PhnB
VLYILDNNKNPHSVAEVFGVEVKMIRKTADERFVIHSTFFLNDAEILCCDDPFLMKSEAKRWPGRMYLIVDNVDEMREKSAKAGFKQVSSMYNPSAEEVKDMSWGDRVAVMEDPYGHIWVLSQPHGKPRDSAEMNEAAKEWITIYDGL